MRTLLTGLLLLALLVLPAGAQTIRFGVEGAYPPWSSTDDDGKLAGFEAELADEICARAAWDCAFIFNDWETMIPDLLHGDYDVILAAMTITPERARLIAFTDDYYPPNPSRFVVAADFNGDLLDPDGVIIGVQAGTVQADYAETMFRDSNTVISFATADEAVAAIYRGAVDAVLAELPYLAPIVDGANGALKLTGPELSLGGGVGMGLRKDDGALISVINATLMAMKADGTLDDMIGRWFGVGPFFRTCADNGC